MEEQRNAISLAAHYLSVGMPRRALEALERTGSGTVFDEEVQALRALAFVELERYDEAVVVARQGLRSSPESVELLHLLSWSESALGNVAKAEEALLSALRIQPDDATLLCEYARLCAKGGQIEKARRLTEQGARLAPDDDNVLTLLSLMAYVDGDDAKSMEHANRLLEENPLHPAAHVMRGIHLVHKGRFGEASQHFGGVAADFPKEQDYASMARNVKAASHWLLWPLRPAQKLGPGVLWIGAAVTMLVLRELGQLKLLAVFALAWVTYCIYSWVAPPLVRYWMRRTRQ